MTFLQLDHPIRWMFLVHSLCGALALLTLLIPLFSKKGGKLHVKSGWVYVYAMAVVGLSAYVITPWRAFIDSNRTPQSISFSIFLFFVATLTLTSIWFGLTVLKVKRRTSPSYQLKHIGPPVVLGVLGATVMMLGAYQGNMLLILFPLIGIVVSVDQIKYWTKSPKEKMHWWYAHMDGMFGACIATITAFLVTAVPRFTDAAFFQSPILWIAPGVLLGQLLRV